MGRAYFEREARAGLRSASSGKEAWGETKEMARRKEMAQTTAWPMMAPWWVRNAGALAAATAAMVKGQWMRVALVAPGAAASAVRAKVWMMAMTTAMATARARVSAASLERAARKAAALAFPSVGTLPRPPHAEGAMVLPPMRLACRSVARGGCRTTSPCGSDTPALTGHCQPATLACTVCRRSAARRSPSKRADPLAARCCSAGTWGVAAHADVSA